MANNNLFEERNSDLWAILNLIKEDNYGDESNVIALTGQFGSGKTFFIEKLLLPQLAMENKKYFYFNVWKYDFTPEPIQQFIMDFLLNLEATDIVNDKKKNLSDKINEILPELVNITSKSLSQYLGTPDIGNDICSIFKKLKKKNSRIETELKNSIIDIARNDFTKLVELALDDDEELIVIIDEIERAKPDSALKFLEMIRHLFSTQKVKFVISCDISYLKAAVEKFYGESINADEYLRKFFRFGYKLSALHDYSGFIMNAGANINSQLVRPIKLAVKAMNCDLRSLERVLYHCASNLTPYHSDIFDYDTLHVPDKIDNRIISDSPILRKALCYVYIFIYLISIKKTKIFTSQFFDKNSGENSEYEIITSLYVEMLYSSREHSLVIYLIQAYLSFKPAKYENNSVSASNDDVYKARLIGAAISCLHNEKNNESYSRYCYPIVKAILDKINEINFFV